MVLSVIEEVFNLQRKQIKPFRYSVGRGAFYVQ